MYAKLICKTGQLAGMEYRIAVEATIGKSAGNTIVLNPQTVSGRHARIFFDEKEKCYFIEDLRSRNGTRVDGVRIKARERLDRLHVITFANEFDFIFMVADEAEPPLSHQKKAAAETPPAVFEQTLIDHDAVALPPLLESVDDLSVPPPPQREMPAQKNGLPAQPPGFGVRAGENDAHAGDEGGRKRNEPAALQPKAYLLEFKNLPGGPRTFVLREGENTIGRSAECEISFDDASLSRRHAVITIKAGKATIRDLGSKNKTFIGGKQRVTAEIELPEGAVITLGLVEAKFAVRG